MTEYLRSARRSMQKNMIFQRGNEKFFLEYVVSATEAISSAISLCKKVNKATITRYEDLMEISFSESFYTSRLIFYKIEKSNVKNFFFIRTTRLGELLFRVLWVDYEPVKKHFFQHTFHPFYNALIESIKDTKKEFGTSFITDFLPKNLSDRCRLKEAQLYKKICYFFVETLRNKISKTIEHNYEKTVRQNSLSIQRFLDKMIKPNRELLQININLNLHNSHYEMSLDPKINERNLWHRVALNAPYRNSVIFSLGKPNDGLYTVLLHAREKYFTELRRVPRLQGLLKGYIWKLEYRYLVTWSYQVVLFFETYPTIDKEEIYDICEALWCNLTGVANIAKFINHPEEAGLNSPAHVITLNPKRSDKKKIIEGIASDLIETDYLVRVDPLATMDKKGQMRKHRAFGKSEIKRR